MIINEQKFNEFKQQGFNRIPVAKEIFADLETPITIFLKLANQPFSYLFESVVGGQRWGRYSFIGLPCKTIIRVQQNKLTVSENNKVIQEIDTTDPLRWLEEYQAQFKIPIVENLPRFFGGLVGYFGYDTIRYIEPRLNQCALKDELKTPDILLMVSDEFVVFDTLFNKVFIVRLVNPQQETWADGQKQVQKIFEKLRDTCVTDEWVIPDKHESAKNYQVNMTQETYTAAVNRALEYMIAGDAMQIVLSVRLQRDFTADPFNFYRALRAINPSPYLFFLNLGDFFIAGSSPEILVRAEDDEITLRPLAGTRRRGHTLEEDLALEKELLADPKELAEHLMLIDLGRNDVGRVSQTGSVVVTEKMKVERYSHVMHIVSNVIGKLQPGLSALEVLRATFPAGTLTGTPKVRAMEIIDELEPVKRNIYAGAIGYLSWNGNMDLAIALRTAVIKNKKIYLQAGSGLVVDSVPLSEWEECMNKVRVLLKAVELAEHGLQISDTPSSLRA